MAHAIRFSVPPFGKFYNPVTGDKMVILGSGSVILTFFEVTLHAGENDYVISAENMESDAGPNKLNPMRPNYKILSALVEWGASNSAPYIREIAIHRGSASVHFSDMLLDPESIITFMENIFNEAEVVGKFKRVNS